MIRVTTGTAKNTKLQVPDIPDFRAVQDVAKMAIFSILGEMVPDARCLDLFAGSGNLGVEALSRGAEFCDFVDPNYKSVRAIETNLNNTKLAHKSEVHQQEAAKFVVNTVNTYNIIFVDPFYDDTKQKYLVENLQHILDYNGAVVYLHGSNLDIKDLIDGTDFFIADSRKYGSCWVEFMKLLEKLQ